MSTVRAGAPHHGGVQTTAGPAADKLITPRLVIYSKIKLNSSEARIDQMLKFAKNHMLRKIIKQT